MKTPVLHMKETKVRDLLTEFQFRVENNNYVLDLFLRFIVRINYVPVGVSLLPVAKTNSVISNTVDHRFEAQFLLSFVVCGSKFTPIDTDEYKYC